MAATLSVPEPQVGFTGMGTYSALDGPAQPSTRSEGMGVSMDSGQSVGLVEVMSNDDLDARARREADARQAAPVITGLAAHVRKCWDAAVSAKQETQRQMIMALNQRRGVYEDDVLARIAEQGGTQIFMMLTDEKCVGAEAWLEELLLPADDKPWGMKPTPVPDLAPDAKQIIEGAVKQRALQDIQMMARASAMAGVALAEEDAARRLALVPSEISEHLNRFAKLVDVELEKRVEDSLFESGWRGALKDFISHLTTFPSAFVKGPIPRMRKRMNWVQTADGFTPEVTETVEPDYEAVSPLDIYPAPMSKDVDDGYLIERHRLTRVDLSDLKGVEGYDDDAIDKVLLESGVNGLSNWLFEGMDTQRAVAEGRSFEMMDPEGRIDALQFWGYVQGQQLVEWGLDSNLIPDISREYSAEVWLIGSNVIRAELNADPLGRKPYYMTSFRKLPGAFWGMGLCEVLQDIQDVCNSAARNIVNNMALSSGPQVGVDVGKMPDGEDVTELFPWKIWQFDMGNEGGTRPPMWFFQPNSTTAELLKIYEHFSTEADNKSGIPRYATGAEQGGGALNTASGLSMMMGNAARGIKRVVKNIDFDIIEPSVQRQIEWELLYKPDNIFKGDIRIQARGSTAMLQRETQQMRRTEALRLVLSSPVAMNLLGMEGVAETLRSVLQGLDIGVEQHMPNEADRKREMFTKIIEQAAGGPEQQALPPGAPQPGPQQTAGGAAPGLGMKSNGPVPTPQGESTPGAPLPRMRVPDPTGAAPSGGADQGGARGMVR